MLTVMVTVQAIEVDVFGAIARWTEDVFSSGTIPPDSVVSESVSERVRKNRIEIPE